MSNEKVTNDDILSMSDDEIFLVAERCGWGKADTRKHQMTPFDRAVWCNQMRAFAIEVRDAPHLANFQDIRINDVARRQYDWVERMGWHNKNDLESMALVASEVGEAAAECVGNDVTPEFGMELADIVLRVADLAQTHQIDLMREMEGVSPHFNARTIVGCRTVLECMAYLMAAVARAINYCRRCETIGGLPACLAEIVFITQIIAARAGVDLSSCIEKKMAINEARGTKGRVV